MTFRRRLSSTARAALYDSEAAKARENGRGEYPICNICDLPVQPGQDWDDSHNKHKPRWLGGDYDGIAHRRCNRKHNNEHDTPLFHKSNRIRLKHIGAYRSNKPLPGGRNDIIGKRVDGTVFDRRTGKPFGGWGR